MEKKEQKEARMLDGAKLNIETIVPQGQDLGFFLVRYNDDVMRPIIAHAIIVELPDGTTHRLTAQMP